MTEIEEERWNGIEKFEGKVKEVKKAKETWCENKINSMDILEMHNNDDCYDLSEFSLWQTGEQNRYHKVYSSEAIDTLLFFSFTS